MTIESNSLPITGVNCKNGKYDAIVYFDGSDFTRIKRYQVKSSALLTKASGRIKSYVLSATGWYKCPNFKFENDKSLEKSKNIEDLFRKIEKAKKSDS
ncbi:MAG: ribosome-binding factor A [Halarcobacter sp.]